MEDGKVLVWGTGKNGSLGLGADLLTIKLPTPIPSLGKYLSDAVSKCSYTTFYQCIPLLLCSLKSQLSNKPKQYILNLFKLFLSFSIITKTIIITTTTTTTTTIHIGISAGVSIGRIACGGEHTMFLTRSGAVYCCGKNTLGQLGLGHTKDIFEPTLIRSLVSTPIRDAACGDCFTIVSEMEQTNLQQCGFIGKPNIQLDAETNICGPGGTFDHDEDGYTKTVIVNLSFENVKLPVR